LRFCAPQPLRGCSSKNTFPPRDSCNRRLFLPDGNTRNPWEEISHLHSSAPSADAAANLFLPRPMPPIWHKSTRPNRLTPLRVEVTRTRSPRVILATMPQAPTATTRESEMNRPSCIAARLCGRTASQGLFHLRLMPANRHNVERICADAARG